MSPNSVRESRCRPSRRESHRRPAEEVDVLEEEDFGVGVHAHTGAHPHVDIRQTMSVGACSSWSVVLLLALVIHGSAVEDLDDAQTIEQRAFQLSF